MIDLTPLDVRKKKDDFRRAVRGYDPVQVNSFLDVVADRMEQLVREHGSLTDRLGHLEASLKSYQERERALNEALLAAQELREEARSQAERDAAVRLREAETHAEAILLDADQAIRHSQRRMEDLRARRRQFLKSLRSMMERLDDYLELEETRVEAEAEDLGDLLERLQSDLGEAEAPAIRPGPEVPPGSVARVAGALARDGDEAGGDEAGGDEPSRGDAERVPRDGEPSPRDEATGARTEAGGSRNGDPRRPSEAAEGAGEPADPPRSPTIPAPTPIAPADAEGPGETLS